LLPGLPGLIGAMQVVGRVIFAPVELRVSTKMVTGVLFGIEAVAVIVLLIIKVDWSILLFVDLFGATQGSLTLACPALVADAYGPAQYGRINGMMGVFLTTGATLGPIGAGVRW